MLGIKINKNTRYKIALHPLDSKTMGHCDQDKKEILLKHDLCKEEMESTLIHEVIHAIDFEGNIKLTEKQTLKLEAGIYEFFRVNKIKMPKLK